MFLSGKQCLPLRPQAQTGSIERHFRQTDCLLAVKLPPLSFDSGLKIDLSIFKLEISIIISAAALRGRARR